MVAEGAAASEAGGCTGRPDSVVLIGPLQGCLACGCERCTQCGQWITPHEWKERVQFTRQALKELQFWKEKLNEYGGMPIVDNRRTVQVDVQGGTDASDCGCCR